MSEDDYIPIDHDIMINDLRVLQLPMPVVREPYQMYAEKLGCSQEAIFEKLCDYQVNKIVRRIAGVLKHQKAGFAVNAMVAMVIPDDQCDTIGEKLAHLPFISHCYRRTSYPDWPFTIYAMVHAKTEDEFMMHHSAIISITKDAPVKVLRSLKEFKKTAFQI